MFVISNNSTPKYQNQRSTNFKSGKIQFFSDFDRTFLPSTQSGIQNLQNASQAPRLVQYFQEFTDFLKTTKNNLTFKITTGRNLGEFKSFANTIRSKGFKMPLPDAIIIKNGSDEHIKIGADKDFYERALFPFKFSETNKQKEEDIRKLSGWDGPAITRKAKALFKDYDFEVRETYTTNSASDYGDKSLFHSFRDDFDSGNRNNGAISPWVASFREDGNLKIHIVLPKDMHLAEDRHNAEQDIHGKIQTFLKDNNVKSKYDFSLKDAESGNHPCIMISPQVNNEPLTKLYDTQQAVKKAAKENDLVIVAGDSSNDFEMLNPVRYLSEHLDNDDDLCYLKDRPDYMVEEMNKRPGLAKKFRELPFVGIIVKNKDKSDAGLDSLVKHFREGKYKKIIVVEEGHLIDGVKQAIKMHAEQKSEFRKNLDSQIKVISNVKQENG